MNTGIQDGYNLAWKLALVVRGQANLSLLETYSEERTANAKRLLQTTDRLFDFAASEEWFVAFVRKHVFPYVANFALSFDRVKHFIFPLVSQIGINYRHSSLSENQGFFKVKAGDRMPYFETQSAGIYEKLKEPKFHVLFFYDGQTELENLAELQSEYSSLMDFHELVLYPNMVETFGANESFVVLLRPDNYIGLIAPAASGDAVKGYLKHVL